MLKRIARALLQPSLFSRILLLTSSSIVAQLIVIVFLPIVSRLFSPAELGVAALVTAVLNFSIPVICLRYDGALPLARRSADAARLVWICVASAVVAGLAIYVAFRILQANDLLGFGILPGWTHWVILASCPGIASFAFAQAWWVRRHNTALIGVNLILRPIAHNGTRVVAGVAGGGVIGLMIAEAAMALAPLYMAFRMPWGRILQFAGPRARLLTVARQWRRFPLIEGPSTLLDSFVVFLPIPMVAMLYGPQVAGLFAIALRIGSIPIGQLGTAISNATYMAFSEAARRGDHERMISLFYRMLKRILVVGLFPMAALAVCGPILAAPILGSAWADTGIYLALLTPWLYAQLAIAPLTRVISVLQRQPLKLISDFTFLAAMILSYWIARRFELNVEQYVMFLSILMVISYSIYFAVLHWALILGPRNSSDH
ncbi:MAG TPA: oligosaccharide flippase family protein [Allosphingosinicella sp.]|nr:oligosaccharide flippase family protein [Allosphingosinicella sp.]